MLNIIEQYHAEIIVCLVRFGKLSREKAEELLIESKLLNNIKEDSVIFHEYPYYWAMQLLYGKSNPEWYLDQKLWPPPEDYI
jgi:hypothetical protein